MGLKDKASKINFASLMPAASPNPDAARPKTAPGAMMALANDQRSELLRENEQLRERAERTSELEGRLNDAVAELRTWDGVKATRLLDPHLIRRSEYANRHESSFQSAEFEDLKREIKEAGGNIQPIKVRAIASPDEGPEYEIVFGHRRHEACLQLGLPVLVFVDNLDDRALFEEMERENRQRADLSAWEQGVMYARALDRGLYPSLRQLAAAVGVDHANISKALVFARLSPVVLQAFASPLDLQFRWATAFTAVQARDPAGLEARARKVAAERGSMTPKAVFAFLTAENSEPVPVPVPGPGPVRAEPSVQEFEKGGAKFATMRVDREGRPSIRIHVAINESRRKQLARLLDEFMRLE